ncbi:outer membrane protein 11 [Chlamydia pneumoniae TW-183]|uniref:Probable outer membrane protein pmp14 n=1 Tax=Chlamydia pneumoniae TaxID=83558 RepID=A0A0F7X239_CHLPN|nr:autotransporter domain-containing protein [Chlamydia pneumoniae]AAD18596.1 Polymorphic Outer Membrane Protein H Family [Chlamydia pneumoniae CWL029]AAP98402.1 outer membrane protein 11 [Chlamydia pneumoniae TW-183]CRI32959.1 Probable outer membrane protein pmp14 [Chlamydia pneumoniae]CRI36950.1 Probable outer membrane protein pmp14 [Chlamydia pneumoniae]CRI38074.1 Probable outer membrane protein pmp14 [Chlamydia pneumoniae]
MPLSFKSSSFCLLACLCSASCAFAETRLGGNFVPPITNQGEEILLTSDFVCSNFLGASFSSSFINSSSNLSLLGKGLSLTFTSCQAPTNSNYALLSAAETLTFKNFSSINFTGNQSTGLGGLIYGKDIVFQSIKDLIFTTNRVAYSPASVTTSATPAITTVTTGASALQPTDSLTVENISQSIKFFGNLANFGSAISSSPTAVVKFINNTATMSFSHNFTSSGGGVIYGGSSLLFENNSGCIIFTANSCVNSLKGVTPSSGTYALGSGGAICIPTGTFELKNNQGKCTFSYNGTPNDAGAIYAETCNIVGNQGALLLDSNTAARNGGAICAKVLNIQGRGPIEFSRNRAEKGGAIFIGPSVGDPAKQTSTLTILASEGDIAFQGNMLNTKPGIRNAITVEAGGEIVSLSAQGGSRLVFYDPITHSLPTTSPSNKDITINANGASGSVVFTSKGLSSTELLLPANTTTILLGTVKIASGELKITDNAVVNVLGFATQGSGQLTLGSGGTLGLATPTGAPAAVDFTIGKLAFDPFSFLKRDFVSASVNAGTKNVTLTGALVLDEHDVTDLYDMVSLQSPVAIPIAVFKGATVTKTGFPDGEIATPSHYGYQGKWSYTWSRPLLIPAPDGGFPGGPSPSANTLYAVWNSDTLVRSTYILDPERYGEIVSNSLWISFLGNQAFSDILQDVLLIDHPGLSITAKALGAYVEHTPRQGHEGFSGRYGGYQAALSMNYTDHTTLGLSFGQLYGKTNANPYDSRCSEQMYLLSFFGQFPIVTQKSEALISWKAAYGYSKNHLNTTYLRPDKAPKSQGQWHNNSYYVLISAEHPFLNWCLLTRPLAQAWDLSGFISAEFLGGWQSKFTETGDLQRSFSRGKGYNVSLPIGCSSQWFTPFKKAPSTLTIKLAYKPDIYRVNPHNIVTVVSNQESTSISGANLRRHGLFVQIHDVVDLTEDTQAFLNYTFDGKNGFTNHRVSTGLKSTF